MVYIYCKALKLNGKETKLKLIDEAIRQRKFANFLALCDYSDGVNSIFKLSTINKMIQYLSQSNTKKKILKYYNMEENEFDVLIDRNKCYDKIKMDKNMDAKHKKLIQSKPDTFKFIINNEDVIWTESNENKTNVADENGDIKMNDDDDGDIKLNIYKDNKSLTKKIQPIPGYIFMHRDICSDQTLINEIRSEYRTFNADILQANSGPTYILMDDELFRSAEYKNLISSIPKELVIKMKLSKLSERDYCKNIMTAINELQQLCKWQKSNVIIVAGDTYTKFSDRTNNYAHKYGRNLSSYHKESVQRGIDKLTLTTRGYCLIIKKGQTYKSIKDKLNNGNNDIDVIYPTPESHRDYHWSYATNTKSHSDLVYDAPVENTFYSSSYYY